MKRELSALFHFGTLIGWSVGWYGGYGLCLSALRLRFRSLASVCRYISHFQIKHIRELDSLLI